FDDDLPIRIDLSSLKLIDTKSAFVARVRRRDYFESSKLAHVRERIETFGLGGLRQARHALEDVAVILIDCDLFTGPILAFEMLANAELAGRIDLPGKLDPEFVFFPHATGVRLVRVLHRLPGTLARDALHRLAEGDPSSAVRLVAVEIVSLGAHAHRQHKV